ncbi:hypothetical protein AXG93_3483s1050 [Marchantia polymorpha subsp. ruderalis]|uniref:Uncharacterized protein n=1 Tax=Marchantia polymorpha subsp. ruderalis TaxID=1480154 RepID=A0A176WCL8_MARPO|nr:hypothetical protein AXG93_3483s1050 [Marchantia polymorpha subsp. ruderalis]
MNPTPKAFGKHTNDACYLTTQPSPHYVTIDSTLIPCPHLPVVKILSFASSTVAGTTDSGQDLSPRKRRMGDMSHADRQTCSFPPTWNILRRQFVSRRSRKQAKRPTECIFYWNVVSSWMTARCCSTCGNRRTTARSLVQDDGGDEEEAWL